MKRFFRILRNLLLGLVTLLLLVVVLLQLSVVQNFLARQATRILSEKLQTEVSVGQVRIDFFNHLLLEQVLFKDRAKDTLLFAGQARVRISDWFFLKKAVPVVRYLGLHDAQVHLYRRPDSATWNFQFVVDAFNTGPRDTTKKKNEFELDLEKLDLRNIRFRMNDAWAGSDMALTLGSLQLNADEVDLRKKRASIDALEISDGHFVMRQYRAGKPTDTSVRKGRTTIDTTAFNPWRWQLAANRIDLTNCAFKLDANEKTPRPGEFDGQHLDITEIDLRTRQVRILGDTITGRLDHLTAEERCGLALRHAEADITVSPRLSECKNLRLETNNSVVGDYYAMHYDRFPDFTDYIRKVRMTARLRQSRVDSRDIAFFAPAMRTWNQRVEASGDFEGTVADFRTRNLRVTDGRSLVQGHLAMKGLPDIEHTLIRFQNGTVRTTGEAILRWAPQLRNHSSVNLALLSFAQFQGQFAGYYHAFLTSGTLVTNLGTITSDVKMNLPEKAGRYATYAGTVRTRDFALGPLLRIDGLGRITADARIEGTGFDPLLAAVNVHARVAALELNGYTYRDLYADGVLARKQFTGTGQVNDPNLAAAFNGSLDFTGPRPVMQATVNLLSSNLRALGFIQDSTQFSGDILVSGNGIHPDDFVGTATVYNINLLRIGKRLDVDSVHLESMRNPDSSRKIVITSNPFWAEITGRFALREVGPTAQAFLAGYMPNYIPPPTRLPQDQDITYSILTYELDTLLSVLYPNIRGFDSSKLYGFMKTGQQKFLMEADVPYGRVGPLYLKDAVLNANGDYQQLLLSGSAQRFATANNLFNATLDFNALLGNDSLQFSIVTQSPDAYGSANIRGQAYASGDTLYGQLQPSDFLLNGDRWEIAGGNSVALSREYLRIRDLHIRSDSQQVDIFTSNETTRPLLEAQITRYDLANLRELAPLAAYQPGGWVSGNVQLTDVFSEERTVVAKLRGSQVQLNEDTLGELVVDGSYRLQQRQLLLQPSSGLFNGDAALTVSGRFGADSLGQPLEGDILLHQAPLHWVQPFTLGSVSQYEGLLNGAIHVGGTAENPTTDGTVRISDGAARLEYTGVTYRIPSATIGLTNRRIDLGTIQLLDRFGNRGTASGSISHRNFRNLRFTIDVGTDGMELLNLRDYENSVYYGEMIGAASVSLRGTVDNMQLNVMRAQPTEAGHLYLPVSSSSGTGTYSFVSFKTPEAEEKKTASGSPIRLSMYMDVIANPLVEVTLILDPATGDAINAKGTGAVRLELPAGASARMYGNYLIESGDYTFTLRQVAFQRKFIINNGSTISFSGPITATKLNVEAIYPTYARLFDLLESRQAEALPDAEKTDARASQRVDLLLRMKGSLTEPALTFDIDLPERRSTGTVAETELRRIRQNERELFDQVASLLLIGTFVPTQGIASSTAGRSVINNVSQILSTNVSGQLTNILSKILGDDKIALDLKYRNYNLADGDNGLSGRNEVRLNWRRNFFNDRLIAELGSAYDWGRPVGNANTSNFNPVGDFRLQYLLQEDGRFRLNVFRTSNYDVLINDNVSRSGAGIQYRRSFNTFGEFFGRRPTVITPTPAASAPVAPPPPMQPDTNQTPARDTLYGTD